LKEYKQHPLKREVREQIIIFSLEFQQTMNSCEFKEIIVFKDFEVGNGVLGLDRDIYLGIVKFLDSSVLRKICLNIIF
jgi:hypothetical protein